MTPRRQFLATGAAMLAAPALGGANADTPASRTFILKETAGLRRFGYPVHTILPAALTGPNFRLERDGKAIIAQFRKVEGVKGASAISLDFNASPGPLESETYTVRSGGADLQPSPEPTAGMRVERFDGSLVVSNGTSLRFKIADPVGPFLQSVTNAKLEFLGGESGFNLMNEAGVMKPLRGSGSTSGPDSPFQGVITREGPMAVGLRFEGVTVVDRVPVSSVVEMTFPNSKSWVEVVWTINDPDDDVSMIEARTGLKLDGPPVLVDLGASNTVYAPLRGNESLRLRAGRAPGLPEPDAPWEVTKAVNKTASPYARAVSKTSASAEGWAHVMDRSRCTAVAVADLGRSTYDEIACSASGALTLRRRFAGPGAASGKPSKSLRFWLHFVSMPVQIGAATSPQAMLAPLVVAWN
jgi:hypothetical protein